MREMELKSFSMQEKLERKECEFGYERFESDTVKANCDLRDGM